MVLHCAVRQGLKQSRHSDHIAIRPLIFLFWTADTVADSRTPVCEVEKLGPCPALYNPIAYCRLQYSHYLLYLWPSALYISQGSSLPTSLAA